jgi:hypothetical protein
MHFKNKGDVEYGHSHVFDHLSLLTSGSVRVFIDEVATDYVAPAMIVIAKSVTHVLEALEDNTVVYCIHALRTGEAIEDIIDPAMIPEGSTPRSVIEYKVAMPLTDGLHTKYRNPEWGIPK